MADINNLGITFPYQEDLTGKFLKMNQNDKDEVKSKIAFLITTQKNQRLYKPDFGLNIEQFLFMPMDEMTYNQVRQEIINTVEKYLTDVKIENVQLDVSESQNLIGLQIRYSITDGILKDKDELKILF
jgi:phage baseplate assembly protein W